MEKNVICKCFVKLNKKKKQLNQNQQLCKCNFFKKFFLIKDFTNINYKYLLAQQRFCSFKISINGCQIYIFLHTSEYSLTLFTDLNKNEMKNENEFKKLRINVQISYLFSLPELLYESTTGLTKLQAKLYYK